MAENEQVHDTWMEIMCSRDLWSDIQGQRDLFFGILESFVSKHNYWIFFYIGW
jgi:hypothetical protein